jgi:hypothetical protein
MRTLTRFHRYAFALAIAIGFTLSACRVLGDVRDVSALQRAIAAQYGEITVINLSNGELGIIFENSKYAALTGSDRDKFVRGVADFAFANYARRDSLSVLSVGFNSVIGAGGLSVTASEAPHSWAARELRAAMDSSVTRKPEPPAPPGT